MLQPFDQPPAITAPAPHDIEANSAVAQGGPPQLSEEQVARKCDGQWREAFPWWAPAREEALENRRQYDGKQWNPVIKKQLEDDGRHPLTLNRIAKALDNMSGKERASRYSWKASPLGEATVQTAAAITKCLVYEAEQSRVKWEISDAADDARLGPMGWLEAGFDDSRPGKEEVYCRRVDPFEIIFDPFSKKRDLDDARYLIRFRQVDLDMAVAAYPDKAEQLRTASRPAHQDQMGRSTMGADYGNRNATKPWGSGFDGMPLDTDPERQRVLLREHWWWVNEAGEFLVLPNGEVYDWEPTMPPEFVALLRANPGARRRMGTRRCFYIAVVCGSVVLSYEKSDYRHERYPYIPVWCLRDHEGRPRGIVSRMIDAQRERNVQRTRANESARSRWALWEKGALGTTQAAKFVRQLGRANFGQEVTSLKGIQIGSDQDKVADALALEQAAVKEIDETVGQNEAAYGDKSQEVSGIAIERKVIQQNQNLGAIFDNLRFARQLAGEMLVALMAQFYTPEKLYRIATASVLREGTKPDATWLGRALANPIDQLRFDVVIEDQAETETERQAAMQQAIDLVGMVQGTPAAAAMVPYVIRMSDFEDKEEMAQTVQAALAPPAPMAGLPSVPGPAGQPPPAGPAVQPTDPQLNPMPGPPKEPGLPLPSGLAG